MHGTRYILKEFAIYFTLCVF